jgi:microcystin-dependent protein
MPIRLANNATAHLAAPLLVGDTTLVLVSGEVGGFPSLSAGEYHPLTIVAPSGAREVVKVTARSSNILTIVRGFEASTPLAFDAGALAEIRMTAGTIDQLQADTAQARTDMLAAMDTKDSALSTTLQATMDSKDNALHTTVISETAAAISAAIAALPTPASTPVGAMLPWTLPNEPSGWIFADGRVLNGATIYPALRTAYINAGFPHGQDGSGNPKIPDMRGVTVAGVDDMGSGPSGRLTGATLGALMGSQTVTLTSAQIPAHTHTASTTAAGAHDHGAATAAGGGHTHTGTTDAQGSHSHTVQGTAAAGSGIFGTGEPGNNAGTATTSTAPAHSHNLSIVAAAAHSHTITAATDHTHPVTVAANTGGDGAHSNIQPTRVLIWIVKT